MWTVRAVHCRSGGADPFPVEDVAVPDVVRADGPAPVPTPDVAGETGVAVVEPAPFGEGGTVEPVDVELADVEAGVSVQEAFKRHRG